MKGVETREAQMTRTRERIESAAYETKEELVIELELPRAMEVDAARASIALRDDSLELRLPKRETVSARVLPGFHPDASPS